MEQFELPKGWEWNSLSHHVRNLESGGRPRGGVSSYNAGIPSISAEQMLENGDFYWEKIKHVPESFFKSSKKGKISIGDILIVKDGATTGKCALIQPDFPFKRAIVNEHTYILRVAQSLLPEYVFFYLKSHYCSNYFEHSRQRGVIGGLTTSFITEIDIPVPSLDVQHMVVAKIKQLLNRIKEVGVLQKMAKADADACWHATINDLLLNLTDNHVHIQYYLIGKPRNGWSPSADSHVGRGAPVLTLSAVTGFKYDGSKVKWTNAETQLNAHYWLKPGELLITRSNTPELVGHAAIYDGNPTPCICPDLIMKMTVDGTKADVRFIHYWLQTTTVRRYIVSRARGTSGTMKKINQGHVQQIPIPRIPLTEQSRIADQLDTVQKNLYKLTRIQSEIDNELASFTPALLAKAFRGELL